MPIYYRIIHWIYEFSSQKLNFFNHLFYKFLNFRVLIKYALVLKLRNFVKRKIAINLTSDSYDKYNYIFLYILCVMHYI